MDDVMNRLSRELAAAVAAAVADDHRVGACYENALTAGYSMKVSLEAVIGFAPRSPSKESTAVSPSTRECDRTVESATISSKDRRFLRSLRIAADEAKA